MSESRNSDGLFAHWQQWRKLCAAKLCSPSAQEYFYGFANRMGSKLRKLGASHLLAPVTENVGYGATYWHEFEYQMHVNGAKNQHRYKDHVIKLLDKCAVSKDARQVECYVSLIFSRAALAIWSKDPQTKLAHYTGQTPVSLQQEAPGQERGNSSRTYADLLASTLDTEAITDSVEDMDVLIKEVAQKLFAGFSYAELLVLLCFFNEISLDKPEVWDPLPVPGRDARYALVKSLKPMLVSTLHRKFPREAEILLPHLAKNVLWTLREMVMTAEFQESHREVIFRYLQMN